MVSDYSCMKDKSMTLTGNIPLLRVLSNLCWKNDHGILLSFYLATSGKRSRSDSWSCLELQLSLYCYLTFLLRFPKNWVVGEDLSLAC